jgi:hypothetical protein
LPAGAVVVKIQFDLPLGDVWRGKVAAPLTSTHLASPVATTVSVTAAPCFAYSVPPLLTVPAPPLNTALLTLTFDPLSAMAAGTFTEPMTVTAAARNATLRNPLEARVAPRVP